SVLALAVLAGGCAEQAEGERCERSNDDNDCEPGLVCTSLQGLTGDSEGSVCCPPRGGEPPKTDICRSQPIDLGGGADDDGAADDDTASGADDDTASGADDDTASGADDDAPAAADAG